MIVMEPTELELVTSAIRDLAAKHCFDPIYATDPLDFKKQLAKKVMGIYLKENANCDKTLLLEAILDVFNIEFPYWL